MKYTDDYFDDEPTIIEQILAKKERKEMITYSAPGMEIKMKRELAKEFVDRLLDEHLFPDPIEDWLTAWGKELGVWEKGEE